MVETKNSHLMNGKLVIDPDSPHAKRATNTTSRDGCGNPVCPLLEDADEGIAIDAIPTRTIYCGAIAISTLVMRGFEPPPLPGCFDDNHVRLPDSVATTIRVKAQRPVRQRLLSRSELKTLARQKTPIAKIANLPHP